MIGEKRNFSEHVTSLCDEAARQLNALLRISKYIDESSRKTYIIASLWEILLIVLLCGTFVVKVIMEKLKK